MVDSLEEVAALRLALADAQVARDDALASVAATERSRQDELSRLRNLFSVIRVIARRTGDDAQTVEEYRAALDGRLSSYLGIQASLARDWQMGSDLGSLIADQFLTFGIREGARAELVGPLVSLSPRAAGILALAFHELTAYAVLSRPLEQEESSIRVSWGMLEESSDHALSIDWIESAPGRDGEEVLQTSWEQWIEQAVSHQLAGTLVIRDTTEGRSAAFRLPRAALI